MILFLDFDGVTHPHPCLHENVFCRLHLIEAVLRERELRGVQVVISSSWRDYHSLEDMREFFSPDMQGRVIGVTPNLGDQAPAFVRERECMAWLETHRPPGRLWLAIDDNPSWFQANCRNLFLTDPLQGFTSSQVASLCARLGKILKAGGAAQMHLAAGRAIYYGDPRYPGQIVKEYPDGRRQLVAIDEQNVVTVIKEI